MLGDTASRPILRASLASDLAENDTRQDYIRATLSSRDGERWVEPFAIQDSSMQSTFARADALIVRAPHAPAAKAGTRVEIIPLD
jgi:molybdopterin molybdotransferase